MSDERKQVNVRLPKELVKKAQHLAIEQGRPLQEIIEELLKEEVEDAEKEAKYKNQS